MSSASSESPGEEGTDSNYRYAMSPNPITGLYTKPISGALLESDSFSGPFTGSDFRSIAESKSISGRFVTL